ncbi:hypothetical protein HMPREF9460_03429, partial [Flavonifractor plautii 1_3_50AFAA]
CAVQAFCRRQTAAADSLRRADEIRGAPAGLGRLGHSGSDEADDKLLLS